MYWENCPYCDDGRDIFYPGCDCPECGGAGGWWVDCTADDMDEE